ncbi:MAG: LPS export ABC transporter periplasmic protein LptC [Gammaproteobacteria bacterium]|nr:LPS export ABC transporter periplasmic protein LptC [Gammaproteobacteria bacterium]NND59578.1 LPS export ABC transporter periplasmic protein LptC [Gammaproteobacteria bacterium]
MSRNAILLVIVVAAAVASFLLIGGRQTTDTPGRTTAESGYYLRDATIEGVDDQGRHIYSLRAERILQQAGEQSVILEQVDLEYALPDTEPWQLRAASGVIPAGGELIELRGDVTMEEQLMRGNPLTRISTPELAIDLLSHTATTSERVDIVRDNYSLSAIGLLADFQQQTLRLETEVNGRFLP